MRLFSQSSQFVFNLPSDIISDDLLPGFQLALEKNHSQYDSPIDYLNHAIKSISFPGMSMELQSQHLRHGKKVDYRPATNVNDILTTRELQITFASKDSDLNYWMMTSILLNWYLRPDIYAKPLIIHALDIYRDVIYTIVFDEVIIKGISDNNFSYSNQQIANKEFTLTINFNFIDIKFNIDGSKIMELNKIIDK